MTTPPEYQPRMAWTVAVLLAVLAFINFIDKIVIGLVAVPMVAELHLSAQQFGLVAGSFFWLFSLSTILVGLLSNRVHTRWLLLAMGASWALLQLPQAVAVNAVALVMSRMALGAAEGPAYPITIHALFKWFPDNKRNLPVAIVNQGAIAGVLLAGLFIPVITHRWGWRANFFLLTAIGGLWCLLWLCLGREGALSGPTSGAKQNVQTVPYRRIMADPSVISVCLIGFASYWVMGLGLSWLPTYIEKALGFSGIAAGRWFAFVIAIAAPVNIGLSWWSQRLLQRGVPTRRARAALLCGVLIIAGALFLVLLCAPLSPPEKLMLYAAAGSLPTLTFSLAPALLAEFVPEAQRGATVAIYTALASLGAAVSPVVMGHFVQTHGDSGAHAYELGFSCGAILLIGSAFTALRWLDPARSRHTLLCESSSVAA